MILATAWSCAGMLARMRVDFYSDPAEFLAVAGDYLAADPVNHVVIGRSTQQPVPAGVPYWYAILSDTAIRGVAMRTRATAPYPIVVPPLDDASVDVLVSALQARGEDASECNGDVASGSAILRGLGHEPQVVFASRLMRLDELIAPRPASGSLRPATVDDVEMVKHFRRNFVRDAETQAGRDPEPAEHLRKTFMEGADIATLVEAGELWIWEDGEPVCMGVVRNAGLGTRLLEQIYTPESCRGRGYASALTADLSQRVLDAGAVPALYTDAANPVSNGVYERLGYYEVTRTGRVVAQD